MLKEVDILVDIEHDGPNPGDYSMVELGAQVIWSPEIPPFHAIIKPLYDKFVPETQRFLDKVELTREFLEKYGVRAPEAMLRFETWIYRVAPPKTYRPIFVHLGGKDWNFVDWYFWHFLGRNPFGMGACELKSLTRGVLHCSWADTGKNRLPPELKPVLPHTHRAHEDAMEHAERFRKAWSYRKNS